MNQFIIQHKIMDSGNHCLILSDEMSNIIRVGTISSPKDIARIEFKDERYIAFSSYYKGLVEPINKPIHLVNR